MYYDMKEVVHDVYPDNPDFNQKKISSFRIV